jgi:galactokinase
MSSPGTRQAQKNPFEGHAATVLAARDFFSSEHPIPIARAPGRLDVMGGNVDYTGGSVLQGLLREAVWVASQARPDDVVRVLNPFATQFGWTSYFELNLKDLQDADAVREICQRSEGAFWGRYVLGAIYFFLQIDRRFGTKPGVDLFIHSDLPPNRGVSSSAALTIASLKAVAAAWQIPLAGIELATAGQWVENVIVGSACGIMDQAAIVLGKRDHLLPLLCQPCIPSPAIALPPGLRIWGIDSMAPRSTTHCSYDTARAAAFMGYRMICEREGLDIVLDAGSSIPRRTDARWNGYLSNLAPSDFRAGYERWLPEALPGEEFLARYGEHADPFTTVHPGREYPVRAAVRYAIEENFRVRTVSSLLKSAARSGSETQLHLIGEILYQSHRAYGECGLGSSDCDDLVDRARRAGFPGAKMTGGGGGGVVAVLGRTEDRARYLRIVEEYAASLTAIPHIFEGSSDGVDAFSSGVLHLPKAASEA